MAKSNECLKQIFSSKIDSLIEENFNINNSISNMVSFSKPNMKRFTFILNGNKYDVVIKNSSPMIIINGIKILSDGKLSIALNLINNHKVFDYDKSYVREKKIYEHIDNSLKKIMIPYYGSYKNQIVLKNIIIDNKYNYKKIIKELIKLHCFYYKNNKVVSLLKLNNPSIKDYKKARKVILKMYRQLDNKIDKEIEIEDFINNMDIYISKYKKHQTLTHNDLSPRNIFMDDNNLYIYDWELSSYQNPEHDLIELLVYSLNEMKSEEAKELIKMYREELYSKINVEYDNKEYKELLIINLKKFIAIRLTMLRIANKKIKMDFIDELIYNCNKLYQIIKEMY